MCNEDMAIAVARQLGGTSNLWGARCLPFDPIDFEPRSWVDARWPIRLAEIEPYLAAAVRATQSGKPVYSEQVPGMALVDDEFACDALERWANKQQAQAIHTEAIAHDPRLEIRIHATLTGIDFSESGCVDAIQITDSRTGERVRMPVGTLVIAAGGLESTRILLAARRGSPGRFGGEEGALGRNYMGHLVGEIADIVFPPGEFERAFDFRIDQHGSYVRRRIVPSAKTQRTNQLLNAAFWPVVPPIADPRHCDAILSLVYLAMSCGPVGRLVVAEAIRRHHMPPGALRRGRHFANVVAGLPAALAFGFDFLRRRYTQPMRLPGFFVRNRARRYGLTYHSEQAPRRNSRVTLSTKTDRLGVPKLSIDYRFCDQDADSVVRTHDVLKSWLENNNLARLEYRVPCEERGAAVLGQAHHGTHQIGLARMGDQRNDAVVDAQLRTFDAPNLYVASTAVLPTSSQANPTLTAIALALRLAEHLAREMVIDVRAKSVTTAA
jgi:choline dehydrogenase-like flavoprotein